MIAKQKATGKTPGMSQELLALIIRNTPGGGQSHDFADNAFWLTDSSGKKYAVNLPVADWPWVQALDRLDRHGDEKLLKALLESGYKQSPRVRRYLADLNKRRLARRKKADQRPRPIHSVGLMRCIWQLVIV
jgi:hypothetical protein